MNMMILGTTVMMMMISLPSQLLLEDGDGEESAEDDGGHSEHLRKWLRRNERLLAQTWKKPASFMKPRPM